MQGFLKAILEDRENELKLDSLSTRLANLENNKFKKFMNE